MKKIEKTDNSVVFIANIEETVANSIRRYVNHIPTYAVDEVEIIKNDSALNDEAIAHRIGLVPLKNEKLEDKKLQKLKLEVKGGCVVYSGDLKGHPEVVYKNIPLTFLTSNRELKLNALVKLGTGSEHSKFSPGLMFYRNALEITTDKKFYKDLKDICPGIEIEEKGNKIVLKDNKKREIADVCEGFITKRDGEIEIEEKDGLIITIESFGQISPEEIFKKSIDALKKDLMSLNKNLEKI